MIERRELSYLDEKKISVMRKLLLNEVDRVRVLKDYLTFLVDNQEGNRFWTDVWKSCLEIGSEYTCDVMNADKGHSSVALKLYHPDKVIRVNKIYKPDEPPEKSVYSLGYTALGFSLLIHETDLIRKPMNKVYATPIAAFIRSYVVSTYYVAGIYGPELLFDGKHAGEVTTHMADLRAQFTAKLHILRNPPIAV